MPVERQILIIYAGTSGALDKFPLDKLREYETQLNAFIDKKHPQIIADIVSKKQLDDDLKKRLNAAFTEFEGVFTG
jgi:F-type H+-transporting ATPase subunit alpha